MFMAHPPIRMHTGSRHPDPQPSTTRMSPSLRRQTSTIELHRATQQRLRSRLTHESKPSRRALCFSPSLRSAQTPSGHKCIHHGRQRAVHLQRPIGARAGNTKKKPSPSGCNMIRSTSRPQRCQYAQRPSPQPRRSISASIRASISVGPQRLPRISVSLYALVTICRQSHVMPFTQPLRSETFQKLQTFNLTASSLRCSILTTLACSA